MEKVEFHCKKHLAAEWSGVLFYKVIEGDTTEIPELKIEAFDFFLMDIGTSGATEYDVTKEIIVYMMQKDLELGVNCYMGHIHSHHNMRSYFSSTDEDELCINAPNHNAYLSLIVNNKLEMVAKIAQLVQVSETSYGHTVPTFSGKPHEVKSAKPSHTMTVSFDGELSRRLSDYTEGIDYSLYSSNKGDKEESLVDAIPKEVNDLILQFLSEDKHNLEELNKEWEERHSAVLKIKQDARSAKWKKEREERSNKIPVKLSGFDYRNPWDRDATNQEEINFKEKSELITDRNLDGTVSFKRNEVEDFLKGCLRVSDRTPITLHEFLTHCEKVENNIASLDHLMVEGVKDRCFNIYHTLFPEDVNFEHCDDLLEECISILDNYYKDDFPKSFVLLNKGIDEALTLFDSIKSDDDNDDVDETLAQGQLRLAVEHAATEKAEEIWTGHGSD